MEQLVWKRQVIVPAEVSLFTSGFDELQMQRQNMSLAML